MTNYRLSFKKEGLIRFTSHLDMLRAFTRAFYRSGLPVYFTEGFNPHPYLILGLPLSLGFETQCDLCDFQLESEIPCDEIKEKLGAVLPFGISICSVYNEGMLPLKKITFARYKSVADYRDMFDADFAKAEALFGEQSLTTIKKSKRGEREMDIKPLIKEIALSRTEGALIIDSVLAAGSADNLNPELLLKLIRERVGIDFIAHKQMRVEILDSEGNVFK